MNLHRLHTLIVKERKQLLRDRSSIVLGLLMPVILLLIFGYGMSLDIRNIKLVIVEQEPSSLSAEVSARFRASEYFSVNIVLPKEVPRSGITVPKPVFSFRAHSSGMSLPVPGQC